eukprot:GHRR01028242.1.p1 GENE.GHRR01028242.1~~GHRR01028242.1.p1  ORF type:complete len:186 (+),score=73.59 GHRR01028242.1:91-648(+)
MALTSGRMFRGMISAWTTSCRMPAISRLLWRAEGPCRSMVAAPPQVAAGDIAGDIDWTEDMAVPVKRRVAALRQLQSDYDALQKQFIKERAELQAKYEQQADPLMDKRESIIAGAAAVNKFDVDDSDEPGEPSKGRINGPTVLAVCMRSKNAAGNSRLAVHNQHQQLHHRQQHKTIVYVAAIVRM